jgi:2',3'-cyclic-nucleotide 2'-phosphodiesterase / 3'-nucleotidase
MYRANSKYFWALSISVLFIFGLGSCREQKPQSITIKIVQTSDVHGAVFPYDFINDREFDGSLARVSTFLKQERSNSSQHVIYIDNGDILQGQPAVYFSNFIDTTGKNLVSRALNYLGAMALTVGNHDVEAGKPVYDKLAKESQFPLLAANITNKDTGNPYFEPYTIINIKGIKVAVLGLITPNVPNWLPKKLWEGMEFGDMLPSAALWMKEIQTKHKPEIVVGMFHDGFGEVNELETGEIIFENASSNVGYHVPDFDLLLIGHDHQLRNTVTKNISDEEVLVLNPGGGCRYVAVATIKLNWNPQSLKYDKQISGELVELSQFDPDPEFMQEFAADYKLVKDFVNAPVGVISSDMYSREAMFGPSAFIDFIHQIQLDITGANVSFVAPLSFDAKVAAGELLVSDMFSLYRFENYLYTMQLTGEEIKNYLEYSYGNWMNQMKNPGDYMLNYRYDEKGELVLGRNGRIMLTGPSYNFDSAAGIIYSVDLTKPAGERIVIKSLQNGKAFILDEKYKVAINSYRGSGGGGHLEVGAGIPKADFDSRLLASTTTDFRRFMMDWIREKGTVESVVLNNWKVIPEDWVKAAKEREMELLFDNQ